MPAKRFLFQVQNYDKTRDFYRAFFIKLGVKSVKSMCRLSIKASLCLYF